ncbi:MAG: hypothetical protein WDN00_07785 [Limisphaerales bacterium]
MKSLVTLFVAMSFLAGCASTRGTDFVQDNIRITPPINAELSPWVLTDGGTAQGTITDAEGRTFPFFVDHRIGSKTLGSIYLMAYPNDRDSIRIRNESEFKQKLNWDNSCHDFEITNTISR